MLTPRLTCLHSTWVSNSIRLRPTQPPQPLSAPLPIRPQHFHAQQHSARWLLADTSAAAAPGSFAAAAAALCTAEPAALPGVSLGGSCAVTWGVRASKFVSVSTACGPNGGARKYTFRHKGLPPLQLLLLPLLLLKLAWPLAPFAFPRACRAGLGAMQMQGCGFTAPYPRPLCLPSGST